MEIVIFLVRQTLNNLSSVITLFFFNAFLEYREPYRHHKLAVHLVNFFFTLILGYLRGVPALNRSFGPFILLTVTHLVFQFVLLIKVFEGSLGFKIFIFLINKLIETVLISFGYSILAMWYPELNTDFVEPSSFLSVIISYSILNGIDILLSLSFVAFYRFMRKMKRKAMEQLFYILIPFSQFFLILLLLYYAQIKDELGISNPFIILGLAASMTACVGDAALFVVLRKIRENSEMESQLKINELQQQYYALLEAQQIQMREMQHDINNHLFTIKTLVGKGNADIELLEYTSELNRKIDMPQLIFCNNRILNALLVNKVLISKERKVQMKIDVAAFDLSYLSDMEIVSLFSNLLDNAIDSASGTENSFVNLQVTRKKNALLIFCENSISLSSGGKTPLDGKMTRGNGLRIIRKIVKKSNGNMVIEAEEGKYQVSILLCGPTSNFDMVSLQDTKNEDETS